MTSSGIDQQIRNELTNIQTSVDNFELAKIFCDEDGTVTIKAEQLVFDVPAPIFDSSKIQSVDTLTSATCTNGLLSEVSNTRINITAPDVYITGNVHFSPPITVPAGNQIISGDASNSVTCQASGQQLVTCGTLTIQAGNDIISNCNMSRYNGIKNSNEILIYGQSLDTTLATFRYQVSLPSPANPANFINLQCWGIDYASFFTKEYYYDSNPYIVPQAGGSFTLGAALGQIMRFKVCFNLRSYYDGVNPIQTTQYAFLYCIDDAAIVKESFTALSLNNDAYKIYGLKLDFTMKVVSNTKKYIVLYSQSLGNTVNVCNYGGQSSLEVTIRQFININASAP